MSDWRRYDSHLIPAFHERFEQRWGEGTAPFLDPEAHEEPLPRHSGSIPQPVPHWPWCPSGPTTTACTARSGCSTCRPPGTSGCFAQGLTQFLEPGEAG